MKNTCCLGCQDRTETCHGTCERYKEFQEENKKKKAWLKTQQVAPSEALRKRANRNIMRKARGWKRSRGGQDE